LGLKVSIQFNAYKNILEINVASKKNVWITLRWKVNILHEIQTIIFQINCNIRNSIE
jgi:hypothetical protein